MKRLTYELLRCAFFISIIWVVYYFAFNGQKGGGYETNVVLKESSKDLKINFIYPKEMKWLNRLIPIGQAHLAPWHKSISSSVAVADVNGDGWPDIFTPSASQEQKSRLFINQEGKAFVDKAEEYGLDSLFLPVRSLFFDCDNDGELEFFSTNISCPYIYKKDSEGVYQKKFIFPEGEHCDFSTAANVFDYNRDGLLDVVLGTFSVTGIPNSRVGAENKGASALFVNQGECTFRKNSQDFKDDGRAFTHAIGIGDIEGDGSQDIWFATDFNDDRVYLDRDGKFEKLAQSDKKSLSHTGMASEWAYLKSETPHIFVSHVYEPGYFPGGNVLWTFQDGSLRDQSLEKGVDRCGWAWGGKFLDLDNDSNLDLIVANGFISRPGAPENLWFPMKTVANLPKGLAVKAQMWPSFLSSSMGGQQRDCVYLNKKNRFINISKQIGFDEEKLDGRGVAVVDLNNDGRQDVIVANQRQRLKVYLNKTKSQNRWLGFELKGTSDNLDAIGSVVRVFLDNGEMLKHAQYPMNGYSSQSDSRLHFGVPSDRKVDKVTVQWLNGDVQKVQSFNMGVYNKVIQREKIR